MSNKLRKATVEDIVKNHWLYIRIQGKLHHVQITGTKESPKGTKILYAAKDGTRGEQLVSVFYVKD